MTDTTSDLPALLGSRICHDLISPLGAIGNGIELLEMSGAANTPEFQLIKDSVESANARIRYYRVAFGAADKVSRIGRAEIIDIIGGTTRGGRLRIDWAVASDISRADAKTVFLLLMCLETALPFGGNVVANFEGNTWSIVANADKMKIDPAHWEALNNAEAQIKLPAAQVHFSLVAHALGVAERTLNVELGQDEIRLTL